MQNLLSCIHNLNSKIRPQCLQPNTTICKISMHRSITTCKSVSAVILGAKLQNEIFVWWEGAHIDNMPNLQSSIFNKIPWVPSTQRQTPKKKQTLPPATTEETAPKKQHTSTPQQSHPKRHRHQQSHPKAEKKGHPKGPNNDRQNRKIDNSTQAHPHKRK